MQHINKKILGLVGIRSGSTGVKNKNITQCCIEDLWSSEDLRNPGLVHS